VGAVLAECALLAAVVVTKVAGVLQAGVWRTAEHGSFPAYCILAASFMHTSWSVSVRCIIIH
jgi:hypothetical protein